MSEVELLEAKVAELESHVQWLTKEIMFLRTLSSPIYGPIVVPQIEPDLRVICEAAR